jgi:predicted transposase/invertase (TIGR01784 family)
MRAKINEIAGRVEGIAMAGGVLLNISRNEVERARLESEYKGKLDLQTKLVDAKREGRQEGRRDGVEQTARNALAKGYTFEQVHDITGLDIQTIKTLQAQ